MTDLAFGRNIYNGKSILLLTASFFGVILATAVFNPSLFFWNGIGIVLLLAACRNLDDKAYRALAIVLSINFIFMLLLYCGYLAKYNTPYFLGDSDDYLFDKHAAELVTDRLFTPEQIQGTSGYIHYNAIGYICYLSWIVRISSYLGGYHPFAPRVLNVYYLSILCVLTYKYFQRHESFTSDKKRLLIYWLGLFPNAVYVSIHNFRDVLCSLLLFVVFYSWDRFPQKKIFDKSAIIIMTLFIAYWIYWTRSLMLLFVGVFILVSLLVGDRIIKLKFKSFIALVILLVILVQVANASGFFDLLEMYNSIYNEYFSDLGSGLSQTIFTTPLLPFGILLRTLYGMIIPVPVMPTIFDVDAFFQTLNSCGTIAQIFLLPYLLYNFKALDKYVIVFCIMYLAIILTTFGFRHLIMLYPFMAIMIGKVYFATTSNCHLRFRVVIVGFLAVLIPTYFFLKA